MLLKSKGKQHYEQREVQGRNKAVVLGNIKNMRPLLLTNTPCYYDYYGLSYG